MSSAGGLFAQTVLLDQEKFQIASNKFSDLSNDMASLRQDIEALLEELAAGFDTPAGRRFMKSCRENLIAQLKDQADVIQHVSENLSIANSQYESVFAEFRALNNSINAI